MLREIRSVTLPDGTRLPYVEQGAASGVPVLLVHGYTDSWRSFETVLPRLPRSIRAIAFSQRGHGDADRPVHGYTLKQLAADLGSVMDALGIEAAVLAGHSMGSSVVARFASDQPHRVLGLVLAGGASDWPRNPDLISFESEVLAGLRDPVDPRMARDFQNGTIARPIPTALLDMFVRESLKLPARVWREAFRGAILDTGLANGLGRIRAPALLLCGDRDTLAWHDQERLATAIAGAVRITYAGTGHALHWEEPERFAADLARFAGALARTRRAAA